MPQGSKGDSHRHNHVNFSCPSCVNTQIEKSYSKFEWPSYSVDLYEVVDTIDGHAEVFEAPLRICNLEYKTMSTHLTHLVFNITKHYQLFLYCKDYYKVNCHWCSKLYLLWFVLLILRCTPQASQVLVLCR